MSYDPDGQASRPPDRDGPAAELPPVEPVSAAFIVQLFIIPFLIVTVVVVVWLLFGKLAGGERDAMDYVQSLRTTNVNRQWRSAYELASLIRNDPTLAEDPKLLGALTGLLNESLEHSRSEPPDSNPAAIAQYLAGAIGAFQTLEALDANGRRVEPLAALEAAAAPKQPINVRVAAVESLARQAARLDGTLDDPEAVAVLEQAAGADDPELRQRAAFALGFFGGDEAARVLRTTCLGDPDRFVRYNAAVALTRRDDPEALPVLREMLSTRDLAAAVRQEEPERARNALEAIQLEALRALQAAVRGGHEALALQVRPAIEDLTGSDLVGVRHEAEALLKELQPVP